MMEEESSSTGEEEEESEDEEVEEGKDDPGLTAVSDIIYYNDNVITNDECVEGEGRCETCESQTSFVCVSSGFSEHKSSGPSAHIS